MLFDFVNSVNMTALAETAKHVVAVYFVSGNVTHHISCIKCESPPQLKF